MPSVAHSAGAKEGLPCPHLLTAQDAASLGAEMQVQLLLREPIPFRISDCGFWGPPLLPPGEDGRGSPLQSEIRNRQFLGMWCKSSIAVFQAADSGASPDIPVRLCARRGERQGGQPSEAHDQRREGGPAGSVAQPADATASRAVDPSGSWRCESSRNHFDSALPLRGRGLAQCRHSHGFCFVLRASSSTRDMGRQRPTCFGRRQRLGASPGSLTKFGPMG